MASPSSDEGRTDSPPMPPDIEDQLPSTNSTAPSTDDREPSSSVNFSFIFNIFGTVPESLNTILNTAAAAMQENLPSAPAVVNVVPTPTVRGTTTSTQGRSEPGSPSGLPWESQSVSTLQHHLQERFNTQLQQQQQSSPNPGRRRPGRPSRAEVAMRAALASLVPGAATGPTVLQSAIPSSARPSSGGPSFAGPGPSSAGPGPSSAGAGSSSAGSSTHSPSSAGGIECVICREGSADSVTKCGHFVCYTCVRDWFLRSRKCPEARCGWLGDLTLSDVTTFKTL